MIKSTQIYLCSYDRIEESGDKIINGAKRGSGETEMETETESESESERCKLKIYYGPSK